MGIFKKAFNYATFKENPLHKADDIINKNLGGYGNVLTTAGMIAAGIATGGIAFAAEAPAYAAIAAGSAVGLTGIAQGGAGIEARKAERDAEAIAAAEQAEINKANAQADAQRRANLLSLRKQVGAVNVGAKSTVFSGGSTTDNKNTATGVVLG